jgi:tetratricopeptide (TPR) repeat protein
MSLWSRIFGKKTSAPRSTALRVSPPATAAAVSSPPARGSPTKACFVCKRTFNALLAICPTCGSAETRMADSPEWLGVLQAHVTVVQRNDSAVQLFREGRLDEAIAELRRGVEANPHYATGYSNLGFLYLRQGQLHQAVEYLLQALEVDPHHKDAPDHLFDVLSALIDELVQIGFSNGFLSTQPDGPFDEHNRHMRAREIGRLLVAMGERGIFTANGRPLGSSQLMRIVVHKVQKKMSYHSNSFSLTCAWEGIGGVESS